MRKTAEMPAATHLSGPGFWLRSLSAWWPWCRSWQCGGCWCLWRWSRCASCCHLAVCSSCLWSDGLHSPSQTRSADNCDRTGWKREKVQWIPENWREEVLVCLPVCAKWYQEPQLSQEEWKNRQELAKGFWAVLNRISKLFDSQAIYDLHARIN